jgi:hypothetical protein
MNTSSVTLATALIVMVVAANFAQEPREPQASEPAALQLALQSDRPTDDSPDLENDRGDGFSPQQMRQLQQMFRRVLTAPRPEGRGPGPDGPPRGPEGPRPGEHQEREVHYHYHYYHPGQHHEEHHTEHHSSHRSVHYHYHYHYN